MYPQVDPKIGENQGGFRKNRSCPEQILSLKLLIRYYRTKTKKNLLITFVDFKKEYDSVDRETLIEILKEYGVDQKTRTLIGLILSESESKVKYQRHISKPFRIKTGLRQGDGLSPILFNVVLDKIMGELWKENDSEAVIGTKNDYEKVKVSPSSRKRRKRRSLS